MIMGFYVYLWQMTYQPCLMGMTRMLLWRLWTNMCKLLFLCFFWMLAVLGSNLIWFCFQRSQTNWGHINHRSALPVSQLHPLAFICKYEKCEGFCGNFHYMFFSPVSKHPQSHRTLWNEIGTTGKTRRCQCWCRQRQRQWRKHFLSICSYLNLQS